MVYRWTHKRTDPTGETIVAITKALKSLDRNAAKEFIHLYLGNILGDEER